MRHFINEIFLNIFCSSISSLEPSTSKQVCPQSQSPIPDDTMSNAEDSCFDDPSSPGSVSQTPMAKKRKVFEMDTNEIVRAFLNSRTKPYDFLPPMPADDVRLFFAAMASTVRKLSPLAIARIKMKVAQIVFEEEIAWAERERDQLFVVKMEQQ